MNITFVDDILEVKTKNDSDYSNVVTQIKWMRTGIADNGYSVNIVKLVNINLKINNPQTFVDYNNLQENDFITWAKAEFTQSQLEDIDNQITSNIQNYINAL